MKALTIGQLAKELGFSLKEVKELLALRVDLSSTNAVTMRRIYGEGFDQPVARMSPSGVAAWYLTDRQGSVRQVVDNAGTTVGSRDYSAFGVITATSGTGLDRYAYTAREWDSTLGLQYTRMRMYDPTTGRFTREDQLGLSAGDVNLHRYVGNAATLFSDPSGLLAPRPALQATAKPTGTGFTYGQDASPRAGRSPANSASSSPRAFSSPSSASPLSSLRGNPLLQGAFQSALAEEAWNNPGMSNLSQALTGGRKNPKRPPSEKSPTQPTPMEVCLTFLGFDETAPVPQTATGGAGKGQAVAVVPGA